MKDLIAPWKTFLLVITHPVSVGILLFILAIYLITINATPMKYVSGDCWTDYYTWNDPYGIGKEYLSQNIEEAKTKAQGKEVHAEERCPNAKWVPVGSNP